MSRSRLQEKLHEAEGRGRAASERFRFRMGLACEFEAWIVHETEPLRAKRIAFPVARLYDDGQVVPVPWTAELLMDFLQPTLRKWRQVYGGNWRLDMRHYKPLADATERQEGTAEAFRRMAANAIRKAGNNAAVRPMPSMPLSPPESASSCARPQNDRPASRNPLDIKPLATGTTGPTRFNPDSDPGLQIDASQGMPEFRSRIAQDGRTAQSGAVGGREPGEDDNA